MQWVIANWPGIVGVLAICILAITAFFALQMSGRERRGAPHNHDADDECVRGTSKQRDGCAGRRRSREA